MLYTRQQLLDAAYFKLDEATTAARAIKDPRDKAETLIRIARGYCDLVSTLDRGTKVR